MPVVPQTRDSSSTTITYATVSSPAPPSSDGMGTPRRPSSASFGIVSCGNRFVSSSSAAIGATSFSANSRTISRIWRWSSVRYGASAPAPGGAAGSMLEFGVTGVREKEEGKGRSRAREGKSEENRETERPRDRETGRTARDPRAGARPPAAPPRGLPSDVLDELPRRRAGPEQPADALTRKGLCVSGRNDTAAGDKDVRETALAQQRDDPREQRHVRPRVEREPDR